MMMSGQGSEPRLPDSAAIHSQQDVTTSVKAITFFAVTGQRDAIAAARSGCVAFPRAVIAGDALSAFFVIFSFQGAIMGALINGLVFRFHHGLGRTTSGGRRTATGTNESNG